VTAIAKELDERLQRLDPATAASVERAIRDTLARAEDKRGNQPLPPEFWTKIREDWGDEPFERPAQGTLEKRDDW
jgi:hypothetical protein